MEERMETTNEKPSSLGYYLYHAKKGAMPNNPPPSQQPLPKDNKFEME